MEPSNIKRLFGTDGIRGEAGKFPLDPGTVRVIGASLARRLAERTGGRSPRIVTGRDTRESGGVIERELIAGARGAGAEVHSAGIITTPGVAFLAGALPADAGVVISASHNPFEDNGIKIFDPSGRKFDDADERLIEKDVATAPASGAEIPDSQTLFARNSDRLRMRYLDHLAHDIADDLSLKGLTMVVDCANGAACRLAPQLFTRLGAQIRAINDKPDGRNINRDCGSLHLEGLRRAVLADSADLGAAFDGDADRVLFVDAKGNVVDGDAALWILAKYMQERGELPGNLVVATVMSNIGLEIALRSRGIKLARVDVGDKYVLDELLRLDAGLGGEQSGHLIFPQSSLAGDGLITTIRVLRAMREGNRSLAELAEGFHRLPQVLVNVRVREKRPFNEVPSVKRQAQEIEQQLGGRGRLLLRYSGTEPLARVMIEGENEKEIQDYANCLAGKIETELGHG